MKRLLSYLAFCGALLLAGCFPESSFTAKPQSAIIYEAASVRNVFHNRYGTIDVWVVTIDGHDYLLAENGKGIVLTPKLP